MEKLELKHLAAYLPYGLKFVENGLYEINVLDGIGKSSISSEKELCFFSDDDEFDIKYCKPILKPLSDLSDIGNWNFLSREFAKIGGILRNNNITKTNICVLSYDLVSLLLENHYDIFGLIEKGLAIDINTLKS